MSKTQSQKLVEIWHSLNKDVFKFCSNNQLPVVYLVYPFPASINTVALHSPPTPNQIHSPVSAAAQTLVLDSDGNPLRSGTKYYILPATDNRRGGVTPIAINASAPCPLDVLQADKNTDNGTPVTFTPVDPKQAVIQEATDLNIKFTTVSSKCPKLTTVWQLATEEEATTGNLYVRTGGVAGNPGAATVNNWFKIEVEQKNYKIVFCPSVCSTCKVKCDFIGVYVDGKGRWRLAQGFLLDNPFLVKFKKA